MKLLAASLPKALYRGQLLIGDLKLDCLVLSNGMRVLTAKSVYLALGSLTSETYIKLELNEDTLSLFFASKNLQSYINQDVISRFSPIPYLDNKQKKIAYIANLLPKLCQLYLNARRNGDLHFTQKRLAIQSEILLSTLAQVGITSLIDETTGYQHDRKHEALRILLSNHVALGLHKLLDAFPDSFFSELDWLYYSSSTKLLKRPQIYAHIINKYIFEAIELGWFKSDLNVTNATSKEEYKTKFYQWLCREGKDMLLNKIHKVQELMKMYSNVKSFKVAAAKQKIISFTAYYFDDENRMIG